MKTNCRIGDLAFIVGGPITENIGRVVRIVAEEGPEESYYDAPDDFPSFDADGVAWDCEGEMWGFGPGGFELSQCIQLIPDSVLRPIRDQPGADETLTWAGKPQESVRDVLNEAAA